MNYTDQELKLAKFFIEREGEGVLKILKDCNMVEEGFLDSLDMVVLAIYVEKEFGVKLDLTSQEVYQAIQNFTTLFNYIVTE